MKQNMKTLLAADGSVYTEKMVAYLVDHPELLAHTASIMVLTVVPELSPRVRALLDQDELQRLYSRDADEVLAKVTQGLNEAYPNVESVWKVGQEAQVIAEFAERNGYDLIVLGSHGRSAVGKLVMGSVATKVLARCEIPILIVR